LSGQEQVHSQAFRIIIRYSRRVRPAHITLEGAMQLCMYVITFYYDKLSNRIGHKLLQNRCCRPCLTLLIFPVEVACLCPDCESALSHFYSLSENCSDSVLSHFYSLSENVSDSVLSHFYSLSKNCSDSMVYLFIILIELMYNRNETGHCLNNYQKGYRNETGHCLNNSQKGYRNETGHSHSRDKDMRLQLEI
jgi:hypothetical protein